MAITLMSIIVPLPGGSLRLCGTQSSQGSPSEPGAFSDEPRGPHPISQFNIIFQAGEFQNIVPWLMLNREGLDVLIHPLTESSYDDHSKNALWMGTPVPMRLDVLRPTLCALSCCRPSEPMATTAQCGRAPAVINSTSPLMHKMRRNLSDG